MNKLVAEKVATHQSLLAEGPVWDSKESRIFWVDILNGQLQCHYPHTGQYLTWSVGQFLGSVALTTSNKLIGAVKSGFVMIDPGNGSIQAIAQAEQHFPDNRFNDGKCDPAGRFWAGTMSISGSPGAGSLYALEKDYTITTKISGVSCSNGIAWSPDKETLYYIDTPTQHVVAYDYEPSGGGICNGRVVVTIPEEWGSPDGMTVDTDGMLWIALWGGWKIIRCDPASGKKLIQLFLPASQVTSCVFGGHTLEDIYVTTARVGLSDADLLSQPLAGSLFVIKKSGFRGLDAFHFEG